MPRYPLSFVVLSGLAVICAVPGMLSVIGLGALLHPLIDDPMAGLALIVSAIALAGSGAFPLVIARLRAADDAARADRG